jgi:hypothetical protein
MYGRDELVAIVSDEPPDVSEEPPGVRLVSWSLESVSLSSIRSDPDWFAVNRRLEIDLGELAVECSLSLGLSPDNRIAFAAASARDSGTCDEYLLLLDLETGRADRIESTGAPALVSADGATLLARRVDGSATNGELLLIDTSELTTVALPVDIPDPEMLFLFHSREADLVVIQSSGSITLVDLGSGDVSELPEQCQVATLVERPGRGELWLTHYRGGRYRLARLDLVGRELEEVFIPSEPLHVNLLPNSDLLVLDARTGATGAPMIWFVDPETRRATAALELPNP